MLKIHWKSWGFDTDDKLIAEVATSMRDFLAWHGAKSIEIEKSNQPAFVQRLMSAM